jgi:uncharacterized membrane protein
MSIAANKLSIFEQERMMARTVKLSRSVVKALTYRIIIMCLDFLTIYLFTGAVHVAVGFMIVSNIYTTVGYLLHERAWSRIHWGIEKGE